MHGEETVLGALQKAAREAGLRVGATWLEKAGQIPPSNQNGNACMLPAPACLHPAAAAGCATGCTRGRPLCASLPAQACTPACLVPVRTLRKHMRGGRRPRPRPGS